MKREDNLKFSIITVCYNSEAMIQATIESVLNQKWQDYEHIIIDGNSTDATAKIVSRYADDDKRIRWYSEEDSGIYNAMNKGIQYAKGNFVYFLNAGDIIYKDDVLLRIAETIISTRADIVIGDRARKDEFGIENFSSYKVGTELRENLKRRINVCHQAIFASRDTLNKGFDEDFKICADYDWLCKQVNAGKKIVKADLIVVNFDIHGVTSKAQNRKLGIKESLKVIKENFPEIAAKDYNEIENLLVEKAKYYFLYRCMNRWLFLKQRKIEIDTYFLQKDIGSIALYGFHYMGQRLYEDLKDSHVKIRYAIDRKLSPQYTEIPIVRPGDILGDVDAIVVTPIIDFLEIRDTLSKAIKCAIISIEEILFYEYETS